MTVLTPARYLGTLCKNGHEHAPGGGQSVRYHSTGACVRCVNEANAVYVASGESAARSRRRIEDHFYRYYLGARRNGPKRGLECSITPDYLRDLWESQSGLCYWIGVPLDLTNRGRRGNWPSKATLERLDCSNGYVPGNVVWASAFANQGRGIATQDEFVSFLREIGLHERARVVASA